MLAGWINKFRIFASRANLALDKASLVVMASLELHNFLRLKSRECYTLKGPSDEIQSNKSK